jgi:arylformamidase
MPKIIDCSMILSNQMWRSGWKVAISPFTKGDIVEVDGLKVRTQTSILHLTVHAGTHIDSPEHFLEGGVHIGDIPIDRCFGDAAVIDLTDKKELEPITAEDMKKRGKHVKEGDIVLLRTGWVERNAGGSTEKMEGLPANWDYWKGPYPTASMAEWMVKTRVKAVGYDGPNECTQHKDIGYQRDRKGSKGKVEDQHVHRIHLSHGILQIEYLCNLTAITKDRVKFFAVPLKLKVEGSPVRAFAIEE